MMELTGPEVSDKERGARVAKYWKRENWFTGFDWLPETPPASESESESETEGMTSAERAEFFKKKVAKCERRAKREAEKAEAEKKKSEEQAAAEEDAAGDFDNMDI